MEQQLHESSPVDEISSPYDATSRPGLHSEELKRPVCGADQRQGCGDLWGTHLSRILGRRVGYKYLIQCGPFIGPFQTQGNLGWSPACHQGAFWPCVRILSSNTDGPSKLDSPHHPVWESQILGLVTLLVTSSLSSLASPQISPWSRPWLVTSAM